MSLLTIFTEPDGLRPLLRLYYLRNISSTGRANSILPLNTQFSASRTDCMSQNQ